MRAPNVVLQKLALGSGWSLLGRLVNLASNLVLSVLLARVLTQREFGGYALGYWLVLVFGNFCLLGGNQIIVRSIARAMSHKDQRSIGRSIANTFALAAIGSVITIGLITLFSSSISQELSEPYLLGLLTVFAVWAISYGLQLLLGEIFRGLGAIGLASLFGGALGNSFITIGAVAVFILRVPISLFGVIAFSAACLVLANLLGAIALLRCKDRGPITPPAQLAKFATEALPLMVMFFGGFVTNQIDLGMLSLFHSHVDAALYGAASRLSVLTGLPKLIIEGSLWHLVASLTMQKKRDDLQALLQISAVISTIPALIWFIIVSLASPTILHIVYGQTYSKASAILITLSAGQLFYTMAGSATIALIMAYRQRDVLLILAGGGIFSALMTLLASAYGSPLMIAMASAVGMIAQNVILISVTRARLGIYPNVTLHSIVMLRASAASYLLKTDPSRQRP